MIVEIAAVLFSIIPSLLFGKVIAYKLGARGWYIVPFQMATGGLIVALGAILAPFAITVAAIGAVVPLTINILAVLYNKWQKRRSLSGAYGQEVQWASEIVDSGDDPEFTLAVQSLPQDQLLEVGIIADDKEELREMTKQRFDEWAEDDNIPQDFMQ